MRHDDHPSDVLPIIRVADLPEQASPRTWLIEELWSAAAVGMVCGAPKSGKTWIGLDMAVSVASGTPCLGRYRVLEPGQAIIYLAEDSLPALRDRIASIGRSRGLALGAMDLQVITAPRLRLDDREDRARLLETMRRYKPRLLLLDPLIRLHGLNENDSREMSELLSFLRTIQRQFDVAVVLVHHARKGGSQVGGQALRGSGDFWAFGDSNLYLRRTDDKLVLSIEHRSAPAPEPVTLRLVDDDEDRVHLETQGTPPARDERYLDRMVLDLLAGEAPLSRSQLRERLRVKNERLGSALVDLERQARIVRAPDGWRLVTEPPSSTERSPPSTAVMGNGTIAHTLHDPRTARGCA